MPQPALLAHELVRDLGGRRVLDGVSLTASPGHRIGLIGENGAGKSTLLRVLAAVDEPDAGSVSRPADLGFLHQEMPFGPESTLAMVLDEALREAREDLAQLERLGEELARVPEDDPGHADLLDAYGKLEHAQDRESWDADRRAALVLDGLGLGTLGHDRTLGSLSGGLRGRLALAALLVRRPPTLLLDEPTNHLDDGAAAFLEEQLRGLPGAVVVASHDRAFLDAVCTDLIDLDPAVDGPVRHGGNYSAYVGEKRADRERRYAEEQEEMELLRHAAGVTARRVAPDRGPRDNEKMGYGHRAGRVRSQISRRVRNASRRLDELERTKNLLLPYPREEAGPLPGREKGARPEQLPVRRPAWAPQFAPLSADRRANGTGTRLRRPTNRATAGEVADQDDRHPTRVAPGARTPPDAARFMPVRVAAPVVAPVRPSAPTVWWSVRSRGSLMPSPE
ncbi:ATP-binding cassette domain-containing protein [Streptomyces sp. NPDC094048]|uniref:ATP-binding cassette domain-containing protein n=1 Tax=Streptomyces sp. NPDC094048 TaxID=3155207 RepID=UPI00332F5E32